MLPCIWFRKKCAADSCFLNKQCIKRNFVARTYALSITRGTYINALPVLFLWTRWFVCHVMRSSACQSCTIINRSLGSLIWFFWRCAPIGAFFCLLMLIHFEPLDRASWAIHSSPNHCKKIVIWSRLIIPRPNIKVDRLVTNFVLLPQKKIVLHQLV